MRSGNVNSCPLKTLLIDLHLGLPCSSVHHLQVVLLQEHGESAACRYLLQYPCFFFSTSTAERNVLYEDVREVTEFKDQGERLNCILYPVPLLPM